MLDPDRLGQDRRDLASGLRQLRRSAGLSGERLAARAAMSQTKISRIETGKTLPTVTDVERILHALNAPPDAVTAFLDLARVASMGFTSIRAYAEMGLWRAQDEITALIRSSTEIRQFLPAIPSGLLQTQEYARCVLTPVIPGDVSWDTERAVTARMARQETLNDQERRFSFLLTENAVRWHVGTPEVMAAQCHRMAELALWPNITLAIVPNSAQIPARPLNMFVLYDDRLVSIEMHGGVVVHRDPKDIAYHRSIFDFFTAHAVTGEAAADLLAGIGAEFMPDRN
ncbi:helix-turn-helix transcriptional regulator [Crossiella sp. S99.1]|uniref:helix-turn-helix domain-containing protein n=1 Tax=Crossiella sp. S99.1 TaxID=2936271 RepID=UPI001FFEE851|nr:helix-turn-helix transcriptional regulator [Crossiella sp. S99.1]MCK2258295.1 helix-turn-helix transcriptional regulator [Crossiella sp. S99.1]